VGERHGAGPNPAEERACVVAVGGQARAPGVHDGHGGVGATSDEELVQIEAGRAQKGLLRESLKSGFRNNTKGL